MAGKENVSAGFDAIKLQNNSRIAPRSALGSAE